jgi:hypothetical protein
MPKSAARIGHRDAVSATMGASSAAGWAVFWASGSATAATTTDVSRPASRRFTASFQTFRQGISVDTGRRTYDLERRGGNRDRHRQEYRSRDGDVRLLVDGDEAELSIDGGDDFEDCERR